MKRHSLSPRPDWRAKVEAEGLIWHSADDQTYWDEAACYSFSLDEITTLEKATTELYRLFLAAGQHVVDHQLFAQFAIPQWCWPLISQAWEAEPPALNYGRFDLCFDGKSSPKLFEFNCDTPTSLLEAAVIQWSWKEERFPGKDQFNSLHERLVARWRELAPNLPRGFLSQETLWFTHAREAAGEDAVTTAYLMDTAREAGLPVDAILISDIGWDGQRFIDLENREMRAIYKLYPWEWMVREAFGENVGRCDRTLWLEPIWKMIWSNKAILPILWELFPDHPNLLWASAERPLAQDYVKKPILGREGANIDIVRNGVSASRTDGGYGDNPLIFQDLRELPDFDGQRPVIGSWIIDGDPAGMGIREDGLITGNLSRFVPHYID
jgi:glutathionylspermidine synthase